jgi:hypothetical protein
MRTGLGVGLSLLLAGVLVGGCSKGSGVDLTASPASAEKSSLERFSTMNEDCLQYLAETRADGIEVWNADYPYFYLVEASTGRYALDASGKRFADGVLYHQARELMNAHPELESHTQWGVLIMRVQQMSKDGKELSRSEPQKIETFDLDELFKKDAETRNAAGSR